MQLWNLKSASLEKCYLHHFVLLETIKINAYYSIDIPVQNWTGRKVFYLQRSIHQKVNFSNDFTLYTVTVRVLNQEKRIKKFNSIARFYIYAFYTRYLPHTLFIVHVSLHLYNNIDIVLYMYIVL